MHFVRERGGRITKEDSLQDRMVGRLYGSAMGRACLKPLIAPAVSQFVGVLLNSAMSRALIRPFVVRHKIRLEDFERREFVSYNDFFTRRLAPGARRICGEPDGFVSPCDGRLSICRIDDKSIFTIKHTRYTVGSLLRSRKLAERFAGGYAWVYRLCVDDYHRYIFVDDGEAGRTVRIPGVLHTVNPIANDVFPIYKENTREYSLIRSEHFGVMLQMEVGAMLVGRIENRDVSGCRVRRGEEKGNFAFGGSTIILMTARGMVRPDKDILANSMRGVETKVKLGERVGTSADA